MLLNFLSIFQFHIVLRTFYNTVLSKLFFVSQAKSTTLVVPQFWDTPHRRLSHNFQKIYMPHNNKQT